MSWNLCTLEMGGGTCTCKAKAGFCDNWTTPVALSTRLRVLPNASLPLLGLFPELSYQAKAWLKLYSF